MSLASSEIESFGSYLKAQGKQASTVESYCRDAGRFADYLAQHKLPVNLVEPQTLESYSSYLRHDLEEKHNSVRRAIIGVRQFFRYLSELGKISSSPFDEVPLPQRDDRLSTTLKTSQLQLLYQACRQDASGLKAERDLSIISLLAREGLKVSEIIGLNWSDLLSAGDDEHSLRIDGTRKRSITVDAVTGGHLSAYRKEHRNWQIPSEFMFIAFKGREAAAKLPKMTRHGIKFMLYERGEECGIEGLNAERLRHCAIVHLMERGLTMEQIMNHLGLRRPGLIAKHFAQESLTAQSQNENPVVDTPQ